MPLIGLSQMFIAKYNYQGGAVTYTDGMAYGRARSFSTSINATTGNNYHADNAVAESDNGTFETGTVDITTAEVLISTAAYIHGLKEKKTEIGGKEFQEVQYGDEMEVPYVGWGCVQKKRLHGKDKYNGLVFPKLLFQISDDETDTQEETISWQDKTETAEILRDDTPNHNWKRKSVDFDTEEEAAQYVKAILGMLEEETPEV